MESEAPDWLNEEFIKDALQNGKELPESESIIVESLSLEKPVAKGDNFISDVFRATVKYKKQDVGEHLNTSFIIKAPKVGGMADFLLQIGALQKEVKIYKKYIPKMDQLFCNDDEKLTPKSYYCNRENVMVLEDLKFNGYIMADRRVQLDYDHTVIAIKTLAAFHGASIRLHEDEPEMVQEIGKEVFYNELMSDVYSKFAKMNFLVLAQECKNDPKLERYTEKVLDYSEKVWDLLVDLVKPKVNCINVLNHGDFWINNMLFKYDNNKKPLELKVIDMQISRYGRPSLDLLHLFYGSVQEEVRIQKLDELLKIYVDELNNTLERFNVSKRLTFLELKSMMKDCEFFAILISVSMYPICIADPNDGTMDLSEVTEDDILSKENNPLLPFYKGKRFHQVIADRFEEFSKSGWF